MKINSGDKTQQAPLSPIAKTKSAMVPSSSFAEVLKKTTKPETAQAISSPTTIRPVMPPSLMPSASEIYRGTERMLEVMEQYRAQLGDSKTDLRAVEPAVRQMKKEMSSLESVMVRTPESDAMKPIAQQTLLAAAKEIARFESGYYN
ncbi:MAG: hypothetical protein M0036_16685 [Desulfobacteraceae bacterium]|nr:hypothetical protein [Desulfobacteraceae bacterium]